MNGYIACQSKRREGNCAGRYSRGLRNQNGEHLVCELNILKKQVN